MPPGRRGSRPRSADLRYPPSQPPNPLARSLDVLFCRDQIARNARLGALTAWPAGPRRAKLLILCRAT